MFVKAKAKNLTEVGLQDWQSRWVGRRGSISDCINV